MSELGDLIKKARKELRITTSQLGDILEISQGYVSHIENGYKTPSPEILRKISKVLNLDLNTLMTLAGYMEGWKDELPPSLRVHFDKTLNKRLSAVKASQSFNSFEDFIKWIELCLDKTFYKEYTQSDLEGIFTNKSELSNFIFKGLNFNETLDEIEKEYFDEEKPHYFHLESSFKLEPLKLEDVLEKAQSLSFNEKILTREERAMIQNVLEAIFLKGTK